jgi:hypothetical protein
MGDLKYLEFDLVVERAGDGYRVRVAESPVGSAIGEFKPPFSPLEIENFQLRLGRSARGVRRVDTPEMEFAKIFGGRLFDALFTGDVRGCLRSSLDDVNRQGAGLRMRLNLSGAPELVDLPWEFLYNPALNRFLALSDETPLVRYLDLPERIRPLIVKPPIRVLLMISSPTDYPPLDVAKENHKVQEALADLEKRGLITIDRLQNATLAELQKRLRGGPYHIFHFIGHGGFDQQADNGILVLEDDQERGRKVSAQFLGVLLKDHRSLRLAVLNACEGARASRCDPFAGTAQTLVQQGLPAVIAMQFEISDEAAICFTHEFYAAIAGGYPVDAALAEARKAIFAQVNEIEWGTPVLYMRGPDARVFDIERMSETDQRLEAERARAAEETRRAEERRESEERRAVDERREAEARQEAEERRRNDLRRRAEEEHLRAEEEHRLHMSGGFAGSRTATTGTPQSTKRWSKTKMFMLGGVAAGVLFVVGLLFLALVGAIMSIQQTDPGDTGTGPNAPGTLVAALPPAESPARPRSSQSEPKPPAAIDPKPTTKPSSERDQFRASLEAFLRRAAEIDIRAVRTLDARGLETTYTGNALTKKVADLATFAGGGMGLVYLVAQLENQTLHDFTATPEGAQVEVSETWGATLHLQATGGCISRIPRHTARQTMLLLRRGDRWMIYDYEAHGVTPEAVPC